jgi:hypothetical protein
MTSRIRVRPPAMRKRRRGSGHGRWAAESGQWRSPRAFGFHTPHRTRDAQTRRLLPAATSMTRPTEKRQEIPKWRGAHDVSRPAGPRTHLRKRGVSQIRVTSRGGCAWGHARRGGARPSGARAGGSGAMGALKVISLTESSCITAQSTAQKTRSGRYTAGGWGTTQRPKTTPPLGRFPAFDSVTFAMVPSPSRRAENPGITERPGIIWAHAGARRPVSRPARTCHPARAPRRSSAPVAGPSPEP